MDSDVYLNDEDNIFHQLRGHYLLINKREHFDFDTFKKPEKEKKKTDPTIPERKHMQVNILEARMQKLQYIKLRRKGGALDEEESDQKNLQSLNTNGYYSLDQLWTRLEANDAAREVDEPKMKTWRQLTEDEQRDKLKEFTDKFKELMDAEVWKELRKELFKQLKDGNFNNGQINWHKGTQKILEISGLVINPACFYWN